MLSRHDEKRLKRTRRELLYWRRAIINSFKEVNSGRYAPDDSREIRENVDRDMELIKHIDPLIMAVSELLELDFPRLEGIPRVTIRNKGVSGNG